MSTLIIKASGEKVPFSAEKLRQSLKRSGADEAYIDKVVQEIQDNLYEGISTHEIFKNAFAHLGKYSKHFASRYKLKQAIMELGPTGFPFEVFVSELLKAQGFKTTVGSILQGHCVTHEVDIIAEEADKLFMVECKFHNLRGVKCDVKVPLYIKSRFDDIVKRWITHPEHGAKFHQGWVVTNTHFSDDAIQYGTCAGLNLLGWDYPKGKGVKDWIDSLTLYPITCLTSLTKGERELLLSKKIILCTDLLHNKSILTSMGISPDRVDIIIKDCTSILKR